MPSPYRLSASDTFGERVVIQSRTVFVAFLLVGAVFAQTSENELRSKISTVRYAPLAEQARIHGDVHLKLSAGAVTVISGHPLLVRIAVESAKSLASIPGQTDLDLTYHFVLVDNPSAVPTRLTVKRGNTVSRVILRMFGFKTEKVVLNYRCQEIDPPANDLKVSGFTLEIWIYGTSHCLQTEAVDLVARR